MSDMVDRNVAETCVPWCHRQTVWKGGRTVLDSLCSFTILMSMFAVAKRFSFRPKLERYCVDMLK